MDYSIIDVANRIKGLRQIMEISIDEMSTVTGVTAQEYLSLEEGKSDFSFTFLYKCAKRFGVDLVEILTGEMPKLSFYSVVRVGEGLPIERRKGFKYRHLAYLLKNKSSEPFFVNAKFDNEEQSKPIALNSHKGEEFNFVLKGSLKMQFENHTEILNEGDCVYYDASRGHGMIATNGQDCEFLAIVIDKG